MGLLLVGLLGCDSGGSDPHVKACMQGCQASPLLTHLSDKVIFKPVKLCENRCKETKGTCVEGVSTVYNPQACVAFGANAGRGPGETGPLLNFKN
ncbi:MAG: hypothetical protein A2600_08725 [Candidatus Lambdaproteobacteria bacterium RIFOXYD1_FULL_56_27]|uniref:Uncharacterized protein n=1 Tax=Candidatus Lambdaproteobacteria bacterium RIFOXYD2_FULL_56_26 TaxID=1817773 RepID=A0A1F6GZA6_9PROT|nr:MAG: hypothetical protein A2426_10145 [Candidatus Lambdaproteobacteria bacterium RIFOXYC1_FULL_56_13]OGH03381.1 MAG: hypothetical protein A2557_02540 [Candidatus Lambdaproteobacteria bacterium RIFOXYD2_FULL_56_26]OGH06614.1 MAG: hypothetical protein A2600_08725 [Candidatus Lambdaproteobacteria bacterium RIFOXYD1_FULL_56_27]